MIEFIIENFFQPDPKPSKPVSNYKSCLPDIEITPKAQKELDKLSYEFLIKLYLQSASATPLISIDSQIWFLEEIAKLQRYINPLKDRAEYQYSLQLLIMEFERLKKLAEDNRKKKPTST